MGARSDFTELYKNFRQNAFFKDAVYTLSWEEDQGSSFDPATGTVTANKITHTAECFSVSSGDKSEQPKSSSFNDVQVNDQFALVLSEEFKTPPNGTQVTWKGDVFTVIESLTDAIDLTRKIQMRR